MISIESTFGKNSGNTEAYSEPSQTFKVELFAKIVNSTKPCSLYVRLGFEHVSVIFQHFSTNRGFLEVF